MSMSALSCDQVREIDRRAIQQLGMSGLVLMENAGRGVVDTLWELGIDGPVLIFCGGGNNGGDGFVIARHLDARLKSVKIVLCADPEKLHGDAAENFRLLTATHVPIQTLGSESGTSPLPGDLASADWIVDALLGTGSRGPPRPPIDGVIDQLNRADVKRLAVDMPSGLDCDTGQPSASTFRAQHTCTFVAPKTGLVVPGAQPYVGHLHVLDIGVPRMLVQEIAQGHDSA